MDWNLQALRRSDDDRLLAGVCAGLGAYTPIPAWLWRVAFIALCFAGGAGVVAYLVLCWQMPAADSDGAPAASRWDLHALRRSTTDRQVDGLCGGLGEHTPVPAWAWRAAFTGMIFAGGAGLVAYALLWLLLPKGELAATRT